MFRIFFSIMSGHPEGRGRATPIFWQKLKLLKKATKVSYFFKIPFASSSLWSETNRTRYAFIASSVRLRGVCEPHPFFGSDFNLYFPGFSVGRVFY